MPKSKKKPLVAIVMGSDSDLPVMKQAADALDKFAVPCELKVISAHRTPAEAAAYAQSARKRGIRVIIAGAGMAAHLAGAMAAQTELPIIGVPLASGSLSGKTRCWQLCKCPKAFR